MKWALHCLGGIGTQRLCGLVLSLLVFAAAGCTQTKPLGEWRGPGAPAAFTARAWDYRGAAGQILESANYRLHSTISNEDTRVSILQLLEAANVEYRRLLPANVEMKKSALDGALMDCFVFSERAQWEDFTRRKTGALAPVYLQINRGGYAIEDVFVAQLTTDRDTWSRASHEGFHQFSAHNFQGRLPPALEEGLACTFETIKWEGTGRDALPRFNTAINPGRAQRLRDTIEARAGWPLAELVTLHAGQVVGGSKVDVFYAQCWAFARFLQDYDNGKYRPAFSRWVADTATGQTPDPTGTHRTRQAGWDPNAVKPLIHYYLRTDMGTLQKQYDDYCHTTAYEEFARQWAGG